MRGYLSGGGGGDATLVLNGPNDAFADTMLHNAMQYGTLGYPWHFKMPVDANPYNFTPDNMSGPYMGCCDWCSDDRLGGELMGLGDCPGAATVVVESTPISNWVWIGLAAWGILMLLKK